VATLVKAHGLGNDYLVLDPAALPFALSPPRIRLICDRHLGVGSDGILALDGAGAGGFGLRIFNPDGSEAEKSGNGIRIFAKWLRSTGRARSAHFTIRTRGGDVPVRVEGDGATRVTADMGEPRFRDDLEELHADGERLRVVALSLGNPHCVVLRGPSTESDLRRLGPLAEHHPAFPDRTNVQLAWPTSRTVVRALIWERGAGETLASGSSACAVAAACVRLGLVERRVEVAMPGGALSIALDERDHVWMTGPAEEVALVELSPELVERLRALTA
jgi:diaminopimelate epimerase